MIFVALGFGTALSVSVFFARARVTRLGGESVMSAVFFRFAACAPGIGAIKNVCFLRDWSGMVKSNAEMRGVCVPVLILQLLFVDVYPALVG